ncbi:hypothetical protein HYR99_13865 [Candidatus Poribacteria bacterium]|nr:hypothetical protein [Candidatus Poribacteria bacterium]
MATKMKIKIASLPDRENLVAELWDDKIQWCEISQEESDPILEIYPHPTGKPWTFPFEEAFVCLQHAKRKLVGTDEPVSKPTMTTKMEITIGSISDRENLVAELWYDNVLWCEISQEEADLTLEIYPHPTGKPWTFLFEEAFAFLHQAKRKLVSQGEGECAVLT